MSYRERPRWTISQEQFLVTYCGELTDDEIAEAIGKTKRAVTTKRQRLEMKKESGRGICKLAEPEQVQPKTVREAMNELINETRKHLTR